MARRPSRSLRLAIRGGIALVVVAVLATAAVATTGSHGATYRTAQVTRAAVSQELHLTGTIEPVAQATVAFPVGGTISRVAVKLGQPVATGQTLATLDTTSLQAQLTKQEAALANAELTLHKVLNGESAGGTGGGSGSGSGSRSAQSATATPAAATSANTSSAATSPSGSGSGRGTGSGAGSGSALTTARMTVTRTQGQVQHALATAQAALKSATIACSTANTTTTTTPTTPPTTATPTPTTAPAITPTTTPTTPKGGPPSCAAAEAGVLRALNAVATAEQALARAESTLSTALAATNAGTGTTPTTTPTTTKAAATTTPTVTYTAAQIVAYEAAVAASASEVAAAQQNLAQATIVSPIAGTVAAVNLTKGTTVSAASSTANIVVVSSRGYEVSTTVTVANRAKVKVGDTATVVADGSGTAWRAKVVAIGVVSSSGTTTTYPVVVGFTTPPTGLRNGASAALTISVAQTANALTVPTSAVQTVGTIHTVTVLTNGKASTVRVQIGTIGAQRTAITSGLRAGQVVALAELGQAIPSAGSSAGTNLRTGSGGAFGGGLSTSTNFGGGFGR